jgi:hypothetical protein
MDPADRAAALLAPAIDRVFQATMRAARERGGRERGGREISRSYGGPQAVGYLVEFRTRLAAPAFAVLTGRERLDLLADLAALP